MYQIYKKDRYGRSHAAEEERECAQKKFHGWCKIDHLRFYYALLVVKRPQINGVQDVCAMFAVKWALARMCGLIKKNGSRKNDKHGLIP